jgi:SpoVK/Ycf46/Vps4 family AAA+-type ATPase
MAGSTGPQGDGGVASDALGAMLSWMQDRTSECFIFATANDVDGLPPELLRKGRWDELWFVDLPNLAERGQVLCATLKTHGRNPKDFDCGAVAEQCEEFTGAELAALVPEAMFAAFADAGREPTTDDLITAARGVVPLAKSMPDKIARLRTWSKRARPATTPATGRTATSGRALDL